MRNLRQRIDALWSWPVGHRWTNGWGHSKFERALLAFHLPEAELTECYQTN